MAKLQGLLKKLPSFAETRMVTNGYGVWLSWKTDLNQAVPQTLTDYGGMQVAIERHQSLWFFFSTDVLLALARLEVWVKFNPIPVYIQVFPTKLLLGLKLEVSLSIDAGIANQESFVQDDFHVWVHPRVIEISKGIPGISYTDVKPGTGIVNIGWKRFQSDHRLPYQANLGWYTVLKPLGNPLDKAFQSGWREFFPSLEEIFKRMKLQITIHNFFVMFQVDNLRQLRAFCKEFLSFIYHVKEDEPARYWPCVLAMVDRKGLNYNNELPTRMRLDWDVLMPDYPHMSYRNAFLLGEGFKVNDVRFSVDQSSLDDWCNVGLKGNMDKSMGALQIELPKRLVSGKETHCFYCGMHSHTTPECPSRTLNELEPTLWDRLSLMNLDTMDKGLRAIDAALAKNPEGGPLALFEGDAPVNLMTRILFELNATMQHRMASTVFRSVGKDYPKALQQLGPMEKEWVWDVFKAFRTEELVVVDRLLSHASLKHPRSYIPRVLQGFSAVEKKDLLRAGSLWKEAESLSLTPLQQSYCLMLQGRCNEMQGKWQAASACYKQALSYSPRWIEASYRQAALQVKMGFAEQAMGFFAELYQRDSSIFNRILLDAELERGQLHILAALYGPWTTAENYAVDEKAALDGLTKELAKWFPEKHPFAEAMRNKISALARQAEIKNFVAFNRVLQGRSGLNRELTKRIEAEAERLKQQYQDLHERLKVIQGEAAWFPFPKVLVEFNKDFNFCAKSVNWAVTQDLRSAENFLQAHEILEQLAGRLAKLETQLKTLKIVRDSTLFLLILGKSFVWLEGVGMLLALILVPLSVYYGQSMGWTWTSKMVIREQWELQKVLVLVMSIVALAAAALRTAMIFEGRKEKLFQKTTGRKPEPQGKKK
jgi:tetratricopeptide (TPR) repeat protein